jgi:hypothetical protein
MGDDHAAVGDVRSDLAESLGDIFVGQAVKAVAAYAFDVQALWNRIMVGDRAVAAMKGGVEAGDLRQAWKTGEQRANRREVVRLVKRRQRYIALRDR